jgi:hypothetical protein
MQLQELLKFADKYGDSIRIIYQIQGIIINNRYMIQELLGEGSYGVIFMGYDLMNVLWKHKSQG